MTIDTIQPVYYDEPERVNRIVWLEGTLYPWQVNHRLSICQCCRKENIPIGEAIRFMRSRRSSIYTSHGYFCSECVRKTLSNDDWMWNSREETLEVCYSLVELQVIPGSLLSFAFYMQGERGLFNLVMSQ